MKPVPISWARSIGQRVGARKVVIIAIDDQYGITTWGKTRAECRLLAGWCESEAAQDTIREIHEWKVPLP